MCTRHSQPMPSSVAPLSESFYVVAHVLYLLLLFLKIIKQVVDNVMTTSGPGTVAATATAERPNIALEKKVRLYLSILKI